MTVVPVGAEADPSDVARLHGIYKFLSVGAAARPVLPDTWAPPWLLTLTIPGTPASKVRHRSTQHGTTYKDPEDRKAEKRTAEYLATMVAGRGVLPGNLALGCVFYRHDRQRIDADNLVKHICDAGNKVAWLDDAQITAQLGVIEYDPVRPRTILVVGPHYSSMDRGGVVAARPTPANRGKRAKRRTRGYGYGSCQGCGKTVAAALTHCGDCRRARVRVVQLDGLF